MHYSSGHFEKYSILSIRYSSFKIDPILPNIGSDDLSTEPHRNDWTDFFY